MAHHYYNSHNWNASWTLTGWGHRPPLHWKPVPVFDLPQGKKMFPNVQSEPLPDKPCISLNVLSWWSGCLLQIHFYNLICHQTPTNKVRAPIPRWVGILLRNSIKLRYTKKCYSFVDIWKIISFTIFQILVFMRSVKWLLTKLETMFFIVVWIFKCVRQR